MNIIFINEYHINCTAAEFENHKNIVANFHALVSGTKKWQKSSNLQINLSPIASFRRAGRSRRFTDIRIDLQKIN